MGDWLKVIVLGIVEGVTEFLPISSTGHLIVAAALLGGFGSLSLNGTFEIFIQFGAVIAVIGYYRLDLLNQLKGVRTDAGVQRLWMGIVIAFIPAGLLGFVFNGWLEAALFRPVVVALSLIVGGIVFIIIERRQPPARTVELTAISYRQALTIGLVQTLALIPGVSRSGASIIGGMLSGLSRGAATQFSFYLAIPTLGVATVYKLLTTLDELNAGDLLMLSAGALVSGVVAWAAVGWLLRYVARNDFTAFGYYRIAAGIAILLLVSAGKL